MIKRRSLKRISRKKSQKRSKTKKRLRSRKFGQNEKDTSKDLIKSDNVFAFFSNWVNPKDLLKMLVYSKNFSKNTLDTIKPTEPKDLLDYTPKENIERFIIWLYKKRINEFVEKMTPKQVLLLTKGKYNKELSNKLLLNKDPEDPEDLGKNISGFVDSTELIFLKSIFGKTLLANIKNFIISLSASQLTLLINGKFNLGNAMFNAFIKTKYPTKNELKETNTDQV